MGKYDDAMYDYFADNERFADLFNAVFFDSKPVLKGEQLEPQSLENPGNPRSCEGLVG